MGMNMQQMMKQAQKMQKEIAKAQAEAEEMTFSASAGGGMVTAVAKGDMTITELSIDPDAIDPDDAEMLEDMVMAAVNEALRGVGELTSTRLNAATGGMNIPGF